MVIDKQTEYSSAQTLTATADSTNIYDAGAQGDAIGKNLWLEINVSTKLDSASHTGTLTAKLVTADDSGFATNLTTLLTANVLTAPITGYVFRGIVPIGLRRYSKVVYTVGTENFNAGAIDARLVDTVDDQLSY